MIYGVSGGVEHNAVGHGPRPSVSFNSFKLPYSSIPITPGHKTAGLQVRQPDGAVGAPIADS